MDKKEQKKKIFELYNEYFDLPENEFKKYFEKHIKEINFSRIDWDEYFMSMAFLISKRSTCLRRQVGAVIVKNNRIISTGYNGAPKKFPHCSEIGCLRTLLNVKTGEELDKCWAVHAEQNAVIQAAVFGTSITDSTLYCTTYPCIHCAKIITNAKIKEVVYSENYENTLSKKLFEICDIKIRKYNLKSNKIILNNKKQK